MKKVVSFGLTDPGLVRRHNEDRYKILDELDLFLVADGMGGHRAGDIAAEEAIDRLCRLFAEIVEKDDLEGKPTELLEEMLRAIIAEVNSEVYALAQAIDKLHGMGTTLSALYLNGGHAFFANVGDSRIYRHRRQRLEQMTRDDSLLADLLDLGQLEEADASDFLYKNVITKSIGMGAELSPRVSCDSVEEGDIFLICSDGLSNMVPRQEIESIINAAADMEEGAKTLVERARKYGGDDNITAILITT